MATQDASTDADKNVSNAAEEYQQARGKALKHGFQGVAVGLSDSIVSIGTTALRFVVDGWRNATGNDERSKQIRDQNRFIFKIVDGVIGFIAGYIRSGEQQKAIESVIDVSREEGDRSGAAISADIMIPDRFFGVNLMPMKKSMGIISDEDIQLREDARNAKLAGKETDRDGHQQDASIT